MAKKSITERVEEIAAPVVDTKGFELVDVEYIKEGPNWYLRIYIDKEGGITIDDCQLVSEELSELLDRYDFILGSYIFEVSSPGLERQLKKDKDFEKYKGRKIEVKLYKPMEKKTVYQGELAGLEGGSVVIKIDGQEFKFERQNISHIKLVYEWN